jgi:hypothetical protein
VSCTMARGNDQDFARARCFIWKIYITREGKGGSEAGHGGGGGLIQRVKRSAEAGGAGLDSGGASRTVVRSEARHLPSRKHKRTQSRFSFPSVLVRARPERERYCATAASVVGDAG